MLGSSWAELGLLVGLLGSLGAILEASWAVLGGRKPKQTRTSRSVNNHGKSMVFASSGSPGGPLGALLGRLEGLFGRLEAVLRASGADVGNLELLLSRLACREAVLEAILAVWMPNGGRSKGRSWASSGASRLVLGFGCPGLPLGPPDYDGAMGFPCFWRPSWRVLSAPWVASWGRPGVVLAACEGAKAARRRECPHLTRVRWGH